MICLKNCMVQIFLFEYKSLMEIINKDDITHQILKNLFGHKKNKEDISDNYSIIDDEAYWKTLKQYYR